MAKNSPTQRSLEHLRKIYPLVQVVEHWNPFAKVRNDLYGFVDVLCVGNGETVAVQTTSGSNVSARIQKIQDSEALKHLREAGWKIVVHGWRKVKVKRGEKAMRWELREVDIS
jgi:hypothetical protein